jgi:hypothetical protein
MSSQMDDPHEPRRSDRVALFAEVGVRRAGLHGFRVRVFDASPSGCKIEFVERPSVGERVWIKFDGLEALEAIVRWVDGHYGGVEFQRALYPSVFERIVR